MEALAKPKIGVTPAKAGVQKFLKRLDSRFRGNDIGLIYLIFKGYLFLKEPLYINPFDRLVLQGLTLWSLCPTVST